MKKAIPMPKIYITEAAPTPLGPIWVAANQRGLVAIAIKSDADTFTKELAARHKKAAISRDETHTADVVRQIKAYLTNERNAFELRIDWSIMTSFQQKVLRATCAIPRAETRTYGEIAAQAGNPRAARAVGRAEATNPIPIVIPCHRVIGADGGLHGYSSPGGLETKAWLLELEELDVITPARA
ncbi:MAG: methylated-DNA--[protein]-cysteine S-methyltransferase [Chloroflexota bacterium]|nr:methylated-DNA--[protein]-cysteine S-methyltransferase [Chloroflexota bacterium]